MKKNPSTLKNILVTVFWFFMTYAFPWIGFMFSSDIGRLFLLNENSISFLFSTLPKLIFVVSFVFLLLNFFATVEENQKFLRVNKIFVSFSIYLTILPILVLLFWISNVIKFFIKF